MKAKFYLKNNVVLMIWKGEDFGFGKPIKIGVYAAKYSDVKYRHLLEQGVTFINRFVDVYPFPGHYKKPRSAQVEMLDFQIHHHRRYNLSEMRTGKSGPVCWNIDINMTYNGIKRSVIFAPRSTMLDTWKTELFGICMKRRVFYSVHKTDAIKKLKRALLRKENPFEVFVINVDKIWRVIEELLTYDPQDVYIDEASDYTDSSTSRYRALAELMSNPKRSLLALTGTPMPNRAPDVWCIARLINPETPSSKTILRQKTQTQVFLKGGRAVWENKPTASRTVAELMQPSIRFRTDDVDDMPEHEGFMVSCDLTAQQQKMYDQMRKDLYTELNGKEITAVHAGAKLWKLLQIASGVCRGEEGEIVLIGAEHKMAETKRLIKETPRKTVIMSAFTAVQDYIISELEGMYRVGRINGSVNDRNRKKMLDGFQGDKLDILVCHPRTTRYGLKMHAASQMLWFGPVYSALDFEQGSFRIRGPGTGKTMYGKLAATPLERQVFDLIDRRMSDQQEMLSMTQVIEQTIQQFKVAA
jgi:hypothetical protein